MISQGNGKFVASTSCLKYHVHNKLTGLRRVYVGIGSLVCIINLLITPVSNVFDTETVKSTRSSFCIFTRLKLQNEDLRQNALFDAKTLKSVGSSCCSYKMKTLAKNALLDAKTLNLMGVFVL